MKLDISCMQYMSKEEFRVLTAVEASDDFRSLVVEHCVKPLLAIVDAIVC